MSCHRGLSTCSSSSSPSLILSVKKKKKEPVPSSQVALTFYRPGCNNNNHHQKTFRIASNVCVCVWRSANSVNGELGAIFPEVVVYVSFLQPVLLLSPPAHRHKHTNAQLRGLWVIANRFQQNLFRDTNSNTIILC